MSYSVNLFKDINKFIHKHLEYFTCNVNDTDLLTVYTFVNQLNKTYHTTLSSDTIISMRNVYVYLLAKSKGVLTMRLGSEIIRLYNEGKSIIEISSLLKIPPMNTYYQIMVEHGQELDKKINKKDIPRDIKSQLHDLQQDNVLTMFDTIPDNNIKNKLKQLKCKYYISKYKHTKKNDLYIITDGCILNDVMFHWILCKPYLLFDNDLIKHDIQKNINKYQKLGKGIILYTELICSSSFLNKHNVYIKTYSFFD